MFYWRSVSNLRAESSLIKFKHFVFSLQVWTEQQARSYAQRSMNWINRSLFMDSARKVTFEVINMHMKAVAPAHIAKYRHSICTFNAFWVQEAQYVFIKYGSKSPKMPLLKSFSLDGARFSPNAIKHLMSLSLCNKKVHLCTHLVHIYTSYVHCTYINTSVCKLRGHWHFQNLPDSFRFILCIHLFKESAAGIWKSLWQRKVGSALFILPSLCCCQSQLGKYETIFLVV